MVAACKKCCLLPTLQLLSPRASVLPTGMGLGDGHALVNGTLVARMQADCGNVCCGQTCATEVCRAVLDGRRCGFPESLQLPENVWLTPAQGS